MTSAAMVTLLQLALTLLLAAQGPNVTPELKAQATSIAQLAISTATAQMGGQSGAIEATSEPQIQVKTQKRKYILDVIPGSSEDTLGSATARQKSEEKAALEIREGEVSKRLSEIANRLDQITLEKLGLKDKINKELAGTGATQTAFYQRFGQEDEKLEAEKSKLSVEKNSLNRELIQVQQNIYNLQKVIEKLNTEYQLGA